MKRTTWQAALPHATLALGLALGAAGPAGAVTFNIGEIEGQLDSSLALSSSWSTAARERDLIGVANGGSAFSQTGDDGRLNFGKGETFSKRFTGLHDLELRYRDSGVFLRGQYWYDFELKDENRRFRPISDRGRQPGAQSSGAQVLDVFLYHNFELSERPGTVRVGRQVVSWGESTFIGNSLDAINPRDVQAYRRPGTLLRDGLLPVNMLYLSQALPRRLSVEAFYQLEWEQAVVANCGTFFSSADYLADGCADGYRIMRGFDAAEQTLFDGYGVAAGGEGVTVPRGADRDARDSGQFGLALHWLGDRSQYGVYLLNYHSRDPALGMQNSDEAGIAAAANAYSALGGAQGEPAAGKARRAVLAGRGRYLLEYPEDIRLYGASFATTLANGSLWAGEFSYRPNAPVRLNAADLSASLVSSIDVTLAAGDLQAAGAQAGSEHRGYRRKDVSQVQTTLTHHFDRVLSADRLTVLAEVGFVHVGGLESRRQLRYGRDALYGTPVGAEPENLAAAARYGWNGFVTRNAWGYRLRAQADYGDLLPGLRLTPNLAFSHDVDGYGPNGLFNEGAKALSLGLDGVYQNTYTASLAYTDFFGGDYNRLVDRDFLTLSLGITF